MYAIIALSMLATETKLNITLACGGKNKVIIGMKWMIWRALIKEKRIFIEDPAAIETAAETVKVTVTVFETAGPAA